ncbi:MAG: peptide/nickel transport system ATP-binding protein ddpF [Rhodospirillaceae bacterium]|nr:peptide/nickel transport system ATP-binding protein ddpF [Rhodospirillaceae bacterium]
MKAVPAIEVRDFSLAYWQGGRWLEVLHDVSLSIGEGEVLGLVGESGCGKSSVAYHLLGYRRANSRVMGGTIRFSGVDLLGARRSQLDRIRGRSVAIVPQNPATALNPGLRIGRQLTEVLIRHRVVGSRAAAETRRTELFRLVGLPNPEAIGSRYPHQLSGGQQQRVCIAIAIACDPSVLVLDEPTTGLDVTTQRQIIDLLKALRDRLGTAMLYVTHDLALLAQIADRVGVMYAGHLVEIGPTSTVLNKPVHPYTRGLMAAIPDVDTGRPPAVELKGLLRREDLPVGCPLYPRCAWAAPACAQNEQQLHPIEDRHEVACERWREVLHAGAPHALGESRARSQTGDRRTLVELRSLTLGYGGSNHLRRLLGAKPAIIARDLNLSIGRGEVFALVGESGSGKSTIARAISGMIGPFAGEILFEERPIPADIRSRPADLRRRIQYIFQNPDESLNPRRRIGEILRQPIERFFELPKSEADKKILQALRDVSLDPGYASRYPPELSGGERQRVAIARALIAEPDLLICDEVLSALDVSVQATVLELLRELQRRRGLTMLFISHDLAVVRSIADRIGVLLKGELVACGETIEIFRPPYHPYTQRLLDAVPHLGSVRGGQLADSLN